MVIPKNQRPEPSIESVVDFLFEIGPTNNLDQITFAGIDFDISVNTRTKPMKIELGFDHPGAKRYIDKFNQFIL